MATFPILLTPGDGIGPEVMAQATKVVARTEKRFLHASDSDEDEGRRRRVFLFVYGLWSLTLAMWNWMRSYSPWWIGLWAATGVIGLATWVVIGRRAVGKAEGRKQKAE